MPRKYLGLIVGCILFLALTLRLYKLGEVPSSLYWDEAAMLVDVKSVAQTGKDMHGRPWFQVIYPSYGDYKLPVYIWFASAVAKLVGVSEFSLRLVSSLSGIGTIIAAAWIAWQLSTLGLRQKVRHGTLVSRATLIALATMLVITIAPWSIMFSRTAFEGHLGQFLLALSVGSLLCARQNPRWFFLSAVLGSVATYTYFSVRFVWLAVFVAATLLLPLFNHQGFANNLKKSLPHIILPVLLFLLCLVPMFQSPLYADSNRFRLGTDSILKNDQEVLQSNVYRELAGNTAIDRVYFHRAWLTARELAMNYSDHLSLNFLFLSGDPNLRHGTGIHGLFPLFLLPFLVGGVFSLWFENKRVLLFLITWWVIALLPAAVPEGTPHALRSLNALVPLSVLIGIGTVKVLSWLSSYVQGSRTVILGFLPVALFCVLVLSFIFSFSFHYFKIYPRESALEWQDGYKSLAKDIFQQKSNRKVFISRFDDRFYLWLMAYGPYTGNEFQSWSSQSYQFQASIPDITFGIPDQKTLTSESAFLVAGKPDEIKELSEKSTRQPSSVHQVYGVGNVARFVIVTYD